MRVVFILAVLVAMPMVHAGGNLTIVGSDIAPSYANTNTTVELLNLTLNVTAGSGDGTVNVTHINITIAGSVVINATGNISSVALLNETGSTIGSNTTINATNNMTAIDIANGFFVTSSTNRSLTVVLTLSPNAQKFGNVSVSINVTDDIGTNAPDNITISGSNTSSAAQVQDLHATAAVSPIYVDTNTVNQTFIYNLSITGTDLVDNFTITIPTNYTIINVTNVTHNAGVLYNGSINDLDSVPTFTQNTIYVSRESSGKFSSATSGTVRVIFDVNTNSSHVEPENFSSTITGSNITDAATYTAGIRVTTQQILQMLDTKISKSTAIVNGTDYWEFNFTINFTANVSGFLQFRMNRWNNSAGQIINLTNETIITNNTHYYASLRNETNFSTTNKFNVTENYNIREGISYTPSLVPATAGTIKTLILRMVLPHGTPITTNWFTSFDMIFRTFA